MIDIKPAAQTYFQKLLGQQEADDLSLRIRVMEPGSPRAACDLQFCPEGGQEEGDRRDEFEAFSLFVAADSIDWLVDAVIDFEEENGNGQLTIKAPNIKGNAPGDEADLGDRIRWVLESEINPRLASHGGMVELETITEATEVILRFGGGCQGCGMADVTLKQGIETTLMEHFPEITAIRDATDHATGENPYYA